MNNIEHICNDLNLPKSDGFTQDWVYELPEKYRTKEWLNKYIIAYSQDCYSECEKDILMTLMLDVVNDLLSQGVSSDNELVVNVLDLLLDNYQFHLQLIDYWSLDGDPLEDCFLLTPKIREIKNNIE